MAETEEQKQEKNELNICSCLYDTIIEGSDKCIFEEFIEQDDNNNISFKVHHRLNLQKKTNQSNDYDMLVLFNNEQIEWDEHIYYRIYRYVFNRGCYANLKPLGKYGVYLYTTGITALGKVGAFILMLDRAVIKQSQCPICMNDIRRIINRKNQKLRIPKELFLEIQS